MALGLFKKQVPQTTAPAAEAKAAQAPAAIEALTRFGVRFDARAFATVLDSEGDLFCVSEGGAGTCSIRAKSDTFLQYAASLGVVIGF